jgi:TPR repeat protein
MNGPARRSVLATFVYLYRTERRLRGFSDFAIFGLLTLVFAHPPSVQWPWPSPASVNVGSAKSTTPGANAPSGAAAPSPRSAAAAVPPGRRPFTDFGRYLNLSPVDLRDRLASLVGELKSNNCAGVLSQTEGMSATDPNVHYFRAICHSRDPKTVSLAREDANWSANEGHPLAMQVLADLYFRGVGGDRDVDAAFSWLEKAYEAGDPNAGTMLVTQFLITGGPNADRRDYKRAREISEKRAADGDSLAMVDLGYLTEHGLGGPIDKQKAFSLYERAANLGNLQGMRNMGICYLSGIGVAVDTAKGVDWLRQAADDYPDAAFFLATHFRDGTDGVQKDPLQAALYFRKAAMKNNAQSQFALAGLYEQGLGVPRDLTQAYVFYGLAKANGMPAAAFNMSQIETLMPADDRKKAAELLAAILPKKP